MSRKTWTEHKLTEAQLRRLAQMYGGLPHLHGVALAALERKGLVMERPVRCPVCGSTETWSIIRHYAKHCDHSLDLLTCVNDHQEKREEWGGTYQHAYQMTTAGFVAFKQARREGW